MNFRTVILGICLLFAGVGTGLAQGTGVSLGVDNHDSSIPVEITSEELELDQKNGTAIFTGDVIVKQGEITMTCQKMRVEYAEDAATGETEIQVIRMYGGVTFVTEQDAAESDSAVYTLTTDMVEMFGNVLVTQGPTALSSDKLTYNLQTGDGQMEGSVKTLLQQGN